MKFHVGAIPENKDFHPESEGWSGIREPGPWMVQFLSIPMGLAVVILLGSLFTLSGLQEQLRPLFR